MKGVTKEKKDVTKEKKDVTKEKKERQYMNAKDIVDHMNKHDHLLILTNPSDPNHTTSKLLKKDSLEYYKLCLFQVTIQPENPDTPLKDILSEYGLMVYEYACNLAKIGAKDEFMEYTLEQSNSGAWFTDKESPYFDPDECGFFNSFKNIIVVGKTKNTKEDQFTTTSPCIFVNKEEGWCYTRSGNIYKLVGKEYSPMEWLVKSLI